MSSKDDCLLNLKNALQELYLFPLQYWQSVSLAITYELMTSSFDDCVNVIEELGQSKATQDGNFDVTFPPCNVSAEIVNEKLRIGYENSFQSSNTLKNILQHYTDIRTGKT